MKLRIRITLAAPLLGLSIASAGAATTCDITLTAGKIASGQLVSGKTAASIKIDGKDEAGGGLLQNVKLGTADVSAGKASGGKLVAKQCQDAGLAAATLANATIEGKGDFTGADGKVRKGVDFTGSSAIALTEAKVEHATIDDPAGPHEAPKEPTVTTEAENMPLAGDWFKLKADIAVAHAGLHKNKDDVPATTLRIPAGTCFRVTTELDESTNGEKTKVARGTFAKAEWGIGSVLPPYNCKSLKDAESTRVVKAGPELGVAAVDDDLSYDIPSETLVSTTDRYRFGWTYGLMVAPFKYYRKARTFDAGAQVGPYIGYRVWDRPGSSTVLAFGIGATSAKVKTVNGNTTTEDTKTGISWAFGILNEFKNSFSVGVLWGADMFSSADAVPKNGAHWIAVSIGYKLSK